ncbi:hypothetical protein JYK14_05770 [Siccirubricoccus sp. KC 17139]|uniref:Uncharacterized protein n=1 Tax=Siccirubricoccus soli TaxID=2899147 RepID=A0ABT1D195_9PROT|nr:hypothetical protein [Siccirubricoccus soli]MCO6415686.1 hypothetical protein [Siccirubricoccus soli]MCP2681818.1 hypothetical protein [Siccirubricoccus soli]
MPDDPQPTPPPAWIAPTLWQTLVTARDAALAAGSSPDEALDAARQGALASWPALPISHLTEALLVLASRPPHTETGTATWLAELNPAPREEVVACLAYALRHDARGKPTPGTKDVTAKLAAEWLADHLARSRFVITRLPPAALHRAGG